MADDVSERERRTRQFEHYLALMEHRTLHVAKCRCFVVFAVPLPRALRPRLKHRIVQFAFAPPGATPGFYADLPDTTLTPEEAKALVRRPGFDYALNKPDKRPGERLFDPVQRQYQLADKRVAAEDAAFVFFDLWHTPLDVWIEVEAAAFDSDDIWESEFSMA